MRFSFFLCLVVVLKFIVQTNLIQARAVVLEGKIGENVSHDSDEFVQELGIVGRLFYTEME